VISGFRSFDRQLELLRARVNDGQAIDELLTVLAPPGSSEHHAGRAVDIGTPGCEPLSEAFCETDAFRWLAAHAAEFDFRLSYPRDNPWGYRYEPWHWCWR
jgi:D-alanyl-D-alanine carboxypeptidase